MGEVMWGGTENMRNLYFLLSFSGNLQLLSKIKICFKKSL